ncbi:unnamed protein product [Heligmosomoides polygyrus]|uniref:Secreted protein n=1 Tax=Heligmosomoides polygyrus TaxID=6339 RepID=A0A183FWE7_HELPZ|nr:unnamed protein product [Heligmosomoides polygyrus]
MTAVVVGLLCTRRTGYHLPLNASASTLEASRRRWRSSSSSGAHKDGARLKWAGSALEDELSWSGSGDGADSGRAADLKIHVNHLEPARDRRRR